MQRKKDPKRTLFFIAALAAAIIPLFGGQILLAATGGTGEAREKASLTADRLDYNPQTNRINARGNVHMTRPDGELFGDQGTGTTDGRSFLMTGNVKGHFTNEKVDIACDQIALRTEGSNPARRVITASGDVELTRAEDRITSQAVSWELDRNVYRAAGNVIGNYTRYYIDADEVSRNGDQFAARGIRRYNDKERGVKMSATRANGKLGPNGDILELVAEGNVVLDTPDNRGAISRITGDKGVFSVARGTLVISGNAMVNQSGRNLHAESIVYHLDNERVEAIGRPSLVIDIPE